mgnify:CR=1 FL=1
MKNLKNLGKALSKAEQKEVNGGKPIWCGYCQCNPGVAYACGIPSRVCPEVCEQVGGNYMI